MLQNPNWENQNNNPVSRLLLNGADLIEQRGHCKGVLMDSKGSLCLVGSLRVCARGNFQDRQMIEVALNAVSRTLNLSLESHPINPVCRVVDWNNEPERTAQEVIDAMRLSAFAFARMECQP